MSTKTFDIRYPGISVYEALVSKDLSEEEKAKIIAEAIDTLSKEFPNLKHVATHKDISETELKLIKEIEQIRAEIKQLDLKIEQVQQETANINQEIAEIKKEIKNLDNKFTQEIKTLDNKFTQEIKALDSKFTKEIELIRKDIKELNKEIKELDLKLTKEIKELDLKFTKEIELTRKEIKETKFEMLKWQFIFWVSQVAVMITIGYKILNN